LSAVAVAASFAALAVSGGKCWQDEEFKVTGKKDVVPDLELTSSDDDPAEGGMSYDYDKPIQ
jgi:hypothetical protein